MFPRVREKIVGADPTRNHLVVWAQSNLIFWAVLQLLSTLIIKLVYVKKTYRIQDGSEIKSTGW